MTDFLQVLLLFVEPMALAFLLVYAYGIFHRSSSVDWQVNVIMGVICGLACVIAMSSPIHLADGIIVDVRNLFVGIAAAYFGLIGGAIALLIGCTMRLQIGGDGMMMGLLGMAIAATMGLVWARRLRPQMRNDIQAFTCLGAMISLHLTAGVLMPSGVRQAFFLGFGPVLAAANVIGSIILGKLIEREQRLAEEARDLASAASIDPLTHLLNRRSAVEAYEMLGTGFKDGHGRAMLCIDVDEFKSVNDTHGHLSGDQVLIQIAERMAKCLRPHDIFSRISGDEFVIVLNDIDPTHADMVAQRCLMAISTAPVTTEDSRIAVTVSIGGAWSPEPIRFKDARSAADTALFQAKEQGRNCVAFITVALCDLALTNPSDVAA